MNTDGIRTTVGLLVAQGLNTLVLLKFLSLDVDQLAGINLFTGTLITFIFYFIKPSTT